MSRSLAEELRLGWIDLEATARGGRAAHGSVRRIELGDSAAGQVVRLAIHDGCRALLIEGAFADELASHATRALHIGAQVKESEGRNLAFVELRCLQPRLNEVFTLMAADIAGRLARGDGPQASIVRAIKEFRDLLRPGSVSVLTLEESMGLFGELRLLQLLVATDPTAVAWWTGPLQGRRDFRSPSSSIEVKTTRDRDFSCIQISSLDQLHLDDGERLYLFAVAVELAADGNSIPELIDAVLELGADGDRLWPLLAAAGYDDRMRPQLDERRFKVWEERLYGVKTDFPRLTADSFVGGKPPLAVREIRYALDLSHASSFLLSAEQQGQAIRDFVEGSGHAP